MTTCDTWYISNDADRIRVKLDRDCVRIVEVMLDGTEVDNLIEMDYDFFVRPKRTKIEIAEELVAAVQKYVDYGGDHKKMREILKEYKNAE